MKTYVRRIQTALRLFFTNPMAFIAEVIHNCHGLIKNDAVYLRLLFFFKTGNILHLSNPITFNEKLQWLKLYDRKSAYTSMVDKFEVKKLVEGKIGSEYVIPTIALFDRVCDIRWDDLPIRFVIKTTNGGGSGGVIVCNDKVELNIKDAARKLQKSYNRNIYDDLREWPYMNVKSRIIVEELLDDEEHGELYDYKVMCFNGKAKLIQVHKGRDSKHTQDFYDACWQKQTAFMQPPYLPSQDCDSTPVVLKDMIEKSEILAKGIPFIRVDWYVVSDHLYFGELTFYDASGFDEFEPKEYNKIFGSWIELPAKTM